MMSNLLTAGVEEAVLRERVERLESENVRLADRLAEIEQQNVKLANLYVSLLQLHETLDRKVVVRAIKEVIVNLVGSEKMGIFEMTADGEAMRLVDSMGIDAQHYSVIHIGDGGLLGSAAARGELFISPAANDHLTAFIPLRMDGRIIAAIAVFGLLPQKGSLEPVDFELFDLLSTQGAMALYCSSASFRVGHA